MGFLAWLFGYDKPEPTPVPTRSGSLIMPEEMKKETPAKPPLGDPFFTNAPEHWPLVENDFLDSNKEFSNTFDEKKSDVILRKRMFMVNSLVLIGKLNRWLSTRTNVSVENSYGGSLLESKDRFATSFCVEKVFAKGIIKTHGIVVDDYKKYAVILFDRSESIHYINKLKELFLEEGFEDLIYYATADPNTIADEEKEIEFVSFDSNSFNLDKEAQKIDDVKSEKFSLWWNGEKNLTFDKSDVLDALKEYHTNCSDCYSYILGKLGYAFKLNENDTRVALPEYDELVVTGPEEVEMIITISKKTGINFHFQAIPEYENYRNNFIKMFAVFCNDIKQQIIEQNFDKDPFFVDPSWLDRLEIIVKNNEEIHSFSLIKNFPFDPSLN